MLVASSTGMGPGVVKERGDELACVIRAHDTSPRQPWWQLCAKCSGLGEEVTPHTCRHTVEQPP